MQLYVIRHAIAEDQMPGEADAKRELTSDGVKKMKRAVKGMRELDWKFDRIVTSPWTRAVQTAALLEPLLRTAGEDPIETGLLAQSPRAELLALIAESTASDTTAIVGHEPWLGELVAWLAFGDTRHGEALRLKKGCVVLLSGSAVPGGMEIQAIIPPSILRAAE